MPFYIAFIPSTKITYKIIECVTPTLSSLFWCYIIASLNATYMVSWRMLSYSMYSIICAMFPKVPWSAGTAGELDKNRSLDLKPDLLKQSSQRACLVGCTPNRHPGWFLSSQKWRELRVEVNQVQPQLKWVIAHFTLSVALPLQSGHSTREVKTWLSWRVHTGVLPRH